MRTIWSTENDRFWIIVGVLFVLSMIAGVLVGLLWLR